MRHRLLGNGLEVSSIGLGCMGMSEFYGAVDPAEALATIRAALDAGVTLLDTADVYGPFTNERLVGQAVAGRRDEVVITTKSGIVRGWGGGAVGELDGRPEYVQRALRESLVRLGVDSVDLYYLHRVDPRVPVEDTVGALADLVAAGLVRHIGLSEVGVDTLRRAQAVHPVTALQSEYSLTSRDPERGGVLAACRELGVGFVACSPLGRGLLTGAVRDPDLLDPDDLRRSHPRFLGTNLAHNLGLVADLREIAQDKGVTSGQLAIAWLLAQGEDVVPIPGTGRRDHLAENLHAAQLVLAPDELRRLDRAFPPGAAVGDRYADLSRLTS
ncbi:MAG: aldo/keto reductase [Frankia sp.]